MLFIDFKLSIVTSSQRSLSIIQLSNALNFDTLEPQFARMSQPRTVEDYFEELRKRSFRLGMHFSDVDDFAVSLNNELAEAKSQYQFMHGQTNDDYINWRTRKSVARNKTSKSLRPPTDQDFWNAAGEMGDCPRCQP